MNEEKPLSRVLNAIQVLLAIWRGTVAMQRCIECFMISREKVMQLPVVRVGVVVVAVIAVVAGLKLFGLAPDDVFTPRNSTSVGTPFGEYHVGSDAHSWFRPLLLTHILCVPAMWWLCRRSGYSGWFSLAMLVPLANVLLLYFLAFAVWPVGQHSTGSSSAAGLRMDTAKEIQSEQNAAKPPRG